MLESGTGSARPFPSEPEDPQGEEGVAARASRHENAEALILLHSSHIFIQSSVTGRGCLRKARRRHPSRSTTPGDDTSGGAAPLRQTPA